MSIAAWAIIILLSVLFGLVIFIVINIKIKNKQNEKIAILESRIELLLSKRTNLVSEIKKNEQYKSSNIDDAINEFNSI